MTSSSVLTAAECFHLGQNQAGENRFWKDFFWGPFPYSRAVALWQFPSWWEKQTRGVKHLNKQRGEEEIHTEGFVKHCEVERPVTVSTCISRCAHSDVWRKAELSAEIRRQSLLFFFFFTGANISRGSGKFTQKQGRLVCWAQSQLSIPITIWSVLDKNVSNLDT